jgi:hypothetical protein
MFQVIISEHSASPQQGELYSKEKKVMNIQDKEVFSHDTLTF